MARLRASEYFPEVGARDDVGEMPRCGSDDLELVFDLDDGQKRLTCLRCEHIWIRGGAFAGSERRDLQATAPERAHAGSRSKSASLNTHISVMTAVSTDGPSVQPTGYLSVTARRDRQGASVQRFIKLAE
jgi:hypothetical protein